MVYVACLALLSLITLIGRKRYVTHRDSSLCYFCRGCCLWACLRTIQPCLGLFLSCIHTRTAPPLPVFSSPPLQPHRRSEFVLSFLGALRAKPNEQHNPETGFPAKMVGRKIPWLALAGKKRGETVEQPFTVFFPSRKLPCFCSESKTVTYMRAPSETACGGCFTTWGQRLTYLQPNSS